MRISPISFAVNNIDFGKSAKTRQVPLDDWHEEQMHQASTPEEILEAAIEDVISKKLHSTQADVIRRKFGLGGFEPMDNTRIAADLGISRKTVSKREKSALEALSVVLAEQGYGKCYKDN